MPIIKGSAFILRPFRKTDINAVFVRNANDRDIGRFTLNVPHPYTMKNAREWVRHNLMLQRARKKEMVNFVIEIGGEAAGTIGLDGIKDKHKAEVGFWLGKRYRNKGVMTEALALVTRYGFETLGLRRIYGRVFTINPHSAKVFQKTGYRLEGTHRNEVMKSGKLLDVYLFAKTK